MPITLGIKIYLHKNNINKATELLNNLTIKSKRNYFLFFYYYKNNNNILFNYFKNNIANKFNINEDEYTILFNNYYDNQQIINYIFNNMKDNILCINNNFIKGNIVKLNNNKCPCCNQELKLIKLSQFDKTNLVNNINTEYNKFSKNLNHLKFLNKNKYDIILDAGNILYHQEGNINTNSFLKLIV